MEVEHGFLSLRVRRRKCSGLFGFCPGCFRSTRRWRRCSRVHRSLLTAFLVESSLRLFGRLLLRFEFLFVYEFSCVLTHFPVTDPLNEHEWESMEHRQLRSACLYLECVWPSPAIDLIAAHHPS